MHRLMRNAALAIVVLVLSCCYSFGQDKAGEVPPARLPERLEIPLLIGIGIFFFVGVGVITWLIVWQGLARMKELTVCIAIPFFLTAALFILFIASVASFQTAVISSICGIVTAAAGFVGGKYLH